MTDVDKSRRRMRIAAIVFRLGSIVMIGGAILSGNFHPAGTVGCTWIALAAGFTARLNRLSRQVQPEQPTVPSDTPSQNTRRR